MKLVAERLELARVRPRPDKCVGCPLHPDTEGFDPLRGGAFVGITGPADAKVLLVGIAPGDEEELQGQAFVGPSGRKVARALEWGGEDDDGGDVGVSPRRPLPLRKMNLVQCRTIEVGKRGRIINRDPTAEEIRYCAERFLWPELVRKVPGRVVKPLGLLAYNWLTLRGPERKDKEGNPVEYKMSPSGKFPGGLAGAYSVGMGHRIRVPRKYYQAQLELKKKKTRKK